MALEIKGGKEDRIRHKVVWKLKLQWWSIKKFNSDKTKKLCLPMYECVHTWASSIIAKAPIDKSQSRGIKNNLSSILFELQK